MIKRYFLLYFFVLTIPVFLGFAAWQSNHYAKLERNVRRLEAIQEEWVVGNSNLIASIAVLSSSSRIEQIALHDLGLSRIQPESVLQVRIDDPAGGIDY